MPHRLLLLLSSDVIATCPCCGPCPQSYIQHQSLTMFIARHRLSDEVEPLKGLLCVGPHLLQSCVQSCLLLSHDEMVITRPESGSKPKVKIESFISNNRYYDIDDNYHDILYQIHETTMRPKVLPNRSKSTCARATPKMRME